LNDWYLNNFLNLFDSFLNHDLWNNSFNDLRNFNNFFDHSGNNNYFFNYLLNFNHFWHLDHFFNNLFNWHLNFFDSINVPEDFHNLLLNVLDGLRNFDIVVDNFLNFNDLWLSDNNWISNFNNDRDLSFNCLNNWLFNNFSHSYNSFVDHWYLYDSLDLLWNLSHHFNDSIHNSLDLPNNISLNYLFNDHLNLIWLLNDVGHLNDLFDNLRYFNDSLFSLDNHNWLLHNSINDYVSNLNVIFNFFGSCNFDFFDNLLDNLFNLNNFRNSNNLFNNLLNDDGDFNYPFNDFFNCNNLFLENLNLFDLS